MKTAAEALGLNSKTGKTLTELCRQTYESIRKQVGPAAADRWHWAQHVDVCPNTERHGCRARLGAVIDAPIVAHPTLDELAAQAAAAHRKAAA